MRYNKIFQYEKGGIQKRSVTVTNDLKVHTRLIPKHGLSLLVKELSLLVNHGEYKRVNPYRFDSSIDRHVYIEFAQPSENGFEIHRKLIIRFTHRKNFKIPEGTFLYDVLDYFVETGLLNEQYKFIGDVNDNIDISVVDVLDANKLVQLGFKFPA